MGLLLVGALLALPFVVVSLGNELRDLADNHRLTHEHAVAPDSHTYLRLEVTKLDEVEETLSVRLTGHHLCQPCSFQHRLTLYSIATTPTGQRAEGVPPSVSITLPASADTISQTVHLPVSGNLSSYPFDTYRLWLGVALDQIDRDGTRRSLTAEEASSRLHIEARDDVPRLEMRTPHALDPDAVQPTRMRLPYVGAFALTFDRPLYLRLLVPLVLCLMVAASWYTATVRSPRDALGDVGRTLLGVWGVRALLLGNLPPNVTAVDGVLLLLIVGILFVASARVTRHLYDEARPSKG